MPTASRLPDMTPQAIVLPANCATVAAEALRNQLVMASETGVETIIDAGAVQTVGQAVLQVLASARLGAQAQHLGFGFCAMSRPSSSA